MAKLLVKQVSKINCPLDQKRGLVALGHYVNGSSRAWLKPYNPWDDKQS
jgi:hypothetical protein